MKTKRRKKVKFLATFLLFIFCLLCFFPGAWWRTETPAVLGLGIPPQSFPAIPGKGTEGAYPFTCLGNLTPLMLPRGSGRYSVLPKGGTGRQKRPGDYGQLEGTDNSPSMVTETPLFLRNSAS